MSVNVSLKVDVLVDGNLPLHPSCGSVSAYSTKCQAESQASSVSLLTSRPCYEVAFYH